MNKVVAAARRLIHERYEEPLRYRELGRAVGCNPEYLEVLFRKHTGTTLRGYLRQTRLERARELVRGGQKVESVALAVGFRSKSGFLRAFRRAFGMTPLELMRLEGTKRARASRP
jgi:AraC-like DNA-binding protein